MSRPFQQTVKAIRVAREVRCDLLEDLRRYLAHLRRFIADVATHSGGVGYRLLAATHLWTFSGLSAARYLYEAHGFVLVEEGPWRQWGNEVLEQRFICVKGRDSHS